MWLVRLGFAAVVLMMVGALVWVISMPEDTPDASAQPPASAPSVEVSATSAQLEASAEEPEPEPEAEEVIDLEATAEPVGSASSEPLEETEDGGVPTAAPTASSWTPPPTVSVNPAWPPNSTGAGTSKPPSQFLKPGPLGPEMDP